jgi:CubicO group peptidase (beta-lactamase class C family)
MMEQGLHIGAQVCVRYHGKLVADFAIGLACPDHPLRPDHRMLWLSAGKPLLAIAVAQFVQRGDLRFEDPVAHYIPEFSSNGKAIITIQHLLTHTHAYQPPLLDWPRLSWPEIIQRICAARIPGGRSPGEYAAYDAQTGWYLLAEIVQRVSGQPFFKVVQQNVLEPCGCANSSIGMPPGEYQQLLASGDLAPLHDTVQTARDGKLDPAGAAPEWPGDNADRAAARNPGGGAIGPACDLCRFYQVLSDLWQGNSEIPLLATNLVRRITARVRHGQLDHTFKQHVDWGLGFLINSYASGGEATPYGYGRHAGSATFGHGGVQCTSAYADPEKAITAAIIFNGLCGEAKHNKRAREVNSLLYKELGQG